MARNLQKIWKAAGSLPLTVALLGVLALQVIYGTLYQVHNGLFEAQRHVFNSWFILIAGVIPLAGVKLSVTCLSINLVVSAIVSFRRSVMACGTLLIHAGIALLFVNAALGFALRRESAVTLGQGESATSARVSSPQGQGSASASVELPFTLRLNSFIIKHHPGSSAIMDYESHVHARGEGLDRDVVISMNRPFRFRDYTVYQSSYRVDGEITETVLAVVKNPIRILPYISGIAVAGGLVVHFLIAFASFTRRRHA